MKAKMTKLLMAAIMTAIYSLGAQAHIAIVQQPLTQPGHPTMTQYKPGLDLSRYDLKSNRSGIKTYASKPQMQHRRHNAAPGQTVTVTCNIVANEDKFGPYYGTSVTLLNSDSNLDYWAEEFGSHQVVCADVPIGTYDILTSQFAQDRSGLCYVIREQVNIASDTTIVLNLDEATNLVEANMLKPDGTLCTVPLIDMATNETIEEGNTNGMAMDFVIVSKEANDVIASHFANRGADFVGMVPPNRIYINNVSDRIKVIVSCSAGDSSTDYMMVQSKDGIDGDFTFVNDPADYVLYQEQFQPTPAYNPEEGGGTTAFDMQVTYNGIMHGGVSGSSDRLAPNGLTSFYLDAPEREDNSIKMLFYPGFGDHRQMSIREWSYEDEEGVVHTQTDTIYSSLHIYGQAAIVTKNGVEYVNSGHDIAGNYSFHVPEDPNADILDYPGNPHFSFTDQQKALAYGTGCPINAVMAQNSYQDWIGGKYSALDFVYLGRYGEVRGSDLSNATLEITYNQDSVICTDLSTMLESMYNFAMEHKEGQIDVDVVNTNVEVDGLPGKNLTHVFYDWAQEDWTAPTLQMLWLRDSEGNIIDRFASGDEGVLEFAGGDFNSHQTDRFWFDCLPQTVEVSYSPYDADTWEAFTVEEVPENFFMPGFGYFYRGELSQVEGNGEKGWFDLKIKLTDLSGNWQEQVISPAFRIDDQAYSSVANVGKDNAHEVARYTLDGRRISTQQPGINIVRYSDGTARKVLVAQ